MNIARLAEENNRQLHPDEKQRVKDLAKELAKEKGETSEFWEEQLTLVLSAMNDEKENQKISNGLEVIFSQTPTHPLNQQDWEKMKTSLGVAYQTLANEAKKNQSLKWQDGSEIVLFGEKVKMFQSTEKQYKNSQMFGNLNYPSLSQYPNTNVATLDDLGKLNGLDNNSLKYRSELFGIIGNSHKPDGTYKEILSPKTVYDPNKFSDSMMLELGQKAAAKGYNNLIEKNKLDSRKYQDSQYINGIKFRYYIDSKDKEVTNVHPE